MLNADWLFSVFYCFEMWQLQNSKFCYWIEHTSRFVKLFLSWLLSCIFFYLISFWNFKISEYLSLNKIINNHYWKTPTTKTMFISLDKMVRTLWKVDKEINEVLKLVNFYQEPPLYQSIIHNLCMLLKYRKLCHLKLQEILSWLNETG